MKAIVVVASRGIMNPQQRPPSLIGTTAWPSTVEEAECPGASPRGGSQSSATLDMQSPQTAQSNSSIVLSLEHTVRVMEESSPFNTGVIVADAIWLCASGALVAVELVHLQDLFSGSLLDMQPFEVVWLFVGCTLVVTTIIWVFDTVLDGLDVEI
jgi:hypothetical protein